MIAVDTNILVYAHVEHLDRHLPARAAIERLFWFNQSWSVAGHICRLPIELHVYAVDATWRLTAWLMRRNPMTPAVEVIDAVDQ